MGKLAVREWIEFKNWRANFDARRANRPRRRHRHQCRPFHRRASCPKCYIRSPKSLLLLCLLGGQEVAQLMSAPATEAPTTTVASHWHRTESFWGVDLVRLSWQSLQSLRGKRPSKRTRHLKPNKLVTMRTPTFRLCRPYLRPMSADAKWAAATNLPVNLRPPTKTTKSIKTNSISKPTKKPLSFRDKKSNRRRNYRSISRRSAQMPSSVWITCKNKCANWHCARDLPSTLWSLVSDFVNYRETLMLKNGSLWPKKGNGRAFCRENTLLLDMSSGNGAAANDSDKFMSF